MSTNSELKSFEFSKTPATGSKKKGTLEVQPDPIALMKPQAEVSVETREDETEKAEKVDEKPKYDPNQLAMIFDELLFQGEYSETVKIKNKLLVEFRTRTSEESEEIAMILDTLGANLFTTLDQKRSILNLQYSLTRYHNKDLSGLSQEDRSKFISKIASPVIVAMVNELAKFDEKVFAALKEGEATF
jgi:hypothetical protein